MDDDLTGDRDQRLLDAMDGTALILDAELRILRIGQPNWTRFLDDNRGPHDAAVTGSIAATLGQPITAVMAGEKVRETFVALFLSVLHGRRNAVRLEHRCDSPALRRDMRLSVTPFETGDAGRHLLYQSVLLSAEARPPIPLFGAEVAADDAPDVLTLCSICALVAWPPGAAPERREWIEPAEYYRRDGAEVVSLSHGLCESCFEKLTEDDAA